MKKPKVAFEQLATMDSPNEQPKEPYKNDLGNRFKQLNEKLAEHKTASEKARTTAISGRTGKASRTVNPYPRKLNAASKWSRQYQV